MLWSGHQLLCWPFSAAAFTHRPSHAPCSCMHAPVLRHDFSVGLAYFSLIFFFIKHYWISWNQSTYVPAEQDERGRGGERECTNKPTCSGVYTLGSKIPAVRRCDCELQLITYAQKCYQRLRFETCTALSRWLYAGGSKPSNTRQQRRDSGTGRIHSADLQNLRTLPPFGNTMIAKHSKFILNYKVFLVN